MVSDSLVKVLMDTDNGRNHLVWVGHQDEDITFTSVVCKLEDVNLDALFKSEAFIKFNYGVGSTGEYFVLKHVAPMADMDGTELLKPLVSLALLGDLLESAITGGDAF
jgi:hypothetical protein